MLEGRRAAANPLGLAGVKLAMRDQAAHPGTSSWRWMCNRTEG